MNVNMIPMMDPIEIFDLYVVFVGNIYDVIKFYFMLVLVIVYVAPVLILNI